MVCDEGISGANRIDTREGLYDALAAVRSGRAEAIAVTALDRVARQMTQQEGVLAEVWHHGGKVFSLGDGGEVSRTTRMVRCVRQCAR